jgi:hypothetical protein
MTTGLQDRRVASSSLVFMMGILPRLAGHRASYAKKLFALQKEGFSLPLMPTKREKRDGIMTVRIPMDEKEMLQKIAGITDITLSDAVVTAGKDFIKANPPSKRSRSNW